METLQAILLALIGAFLGITVYQISRPKPVKVERVEVIEQPAVLPYWTSYDPGYGYYPRWMDSYWLNYVPFYGPIAGGSYYSPWGGGRHNYMPHHWASRGGGHSGVAVGGGGGGHGGGHGGGGSRGGH
jgi:uncharacterized membrane protein YgcG